MSVPKLNSRSGPDDRRCDTCTFADDVCWNEPDPDIDIYVDFCKHPDCGYDDVICKTMYWGTPEMTYTFDGWEPEWCPLAKGV